MGFNPALLWKAPDINPINNKARSIPILNPINKYGRVFNFSWFGFFIAFWSWYAFPPLLNDVIKKDIHLSKNEVLNSNIIALVATLLVRVFAGTLCDRFGPRNTFAGCLIVGAVPTFCAGGVTNAAGLYALRFFVGILGGSFVPCQVWTTAFFDKNVVGTANALTGGWGNSGGGVTYFVMPAIYNSLMRDQGESSHVAWRVAFVVPGILIVVTAAALVLLCPDTPTGKWSERLQNVEKNLQTHTDGTIVDVPGKITVNPTSTGTESPSSEEEKGDFKPPKEVFAANEAPLSGTEMLESAQGEVVQKPSWSEAMKVVLSLQTLVQGAAYFNSFGAELAINSILGNYYKKNFKDLSLQDTGNWAAMFGLLNIVARPLGGFTSDNLYRATGRNLWAKKMLIHGLGIITGAFLLAIGLLDSHDKSTMFGLVAGMAIFLEAGNGANYSLVPHVHPHANGIISGITGASGNLGGIIFSIIFRYNGTDYAKSFWIIGIIGMVLNAAVSWIRPIPKNQIGGK